MTPFFYRKDFVFIANRYEEWQFGSCISKGPISTKNVSTVHGNTIHFELEDIGSICIRKSFDIESHGEECDNLGDRIQFFNTWISDDDDHSTPSICHIFHDGYMMKYIRFAMSNPDRLIEFYGTFAGYGVSTNTTDKVTSFSLQEMANKYGSVAVGHQNMKRSDGTEFTAYGLKFGKGFHSCFAAFSGRIANDDHTQRDSQFKGLNGVEIGKYIWENQNDYQVVCKKSSENGQLLYRKDGTPVYTILPRDRNNKE